VVFYDELAFGWPKNVLLRMSPCGELKAPPDWHFLSGPGIYIDLGLLVDLGTALLVSITVLVLAERGKSRLAV
jgi:hypothetical protein